MHALKRHLDLKRSVSREARVAVIPPLFAATTDAHGLDQMLQRNFAKVLCRLLKRREEEPLPMSLPWRPIYQMIDRLLFGKARTPQTPLCRNVPYYAVSLARHARRYFVPGANAEILAELRPFCCPHDMSLMRAQALLCLLLPRGSPDAADVVDQIFAMWSWIVSYTDWDLHWMQLLSSLCRHTYRLQHSLWDGYLTSVFSHVLHCLDLPVGPSAIHMYDNKESSIGHSDGYPLGSLSVLAHKGQVRSKSLQVATKAAKMIVYLLRPRGGRGGRGGEGAGDADDDDGSAMGHLRRMCKAIESFLHPSNGGYWTRRLTQMLSALCSHMLDRVRRERASDPGSALRLQAEDIHAFVQIVMPLALQGLYSKNSGAMGQACNALQDLAQIDADTVLPPLLDRAYSALTTLTEVHQASSALEALCCVIYPVLQLERFRGGASHLPTLMNLTLSGIDTNDARKTWSTLRFYAIVLSGLPLIPIDDGPVPEACDAALHAEAVQAMEMLSDWPLRFLDQTIAFMLHQHSAQPHAESDDQQSTKGDRESRTSDYLLQCALDVCFMQMDDTLYHKAVHKVADLCFGNLLYQHQAQLGVLLTAITAVDAEFVVNKMVPLCLRILLELDTDKVPLSSHRTPRARASRGSPATAKSPCAPGGVPPMVSPSDPARSEAQSPGTPSAVPSGAVRLAALSETELVYYLSILRYVAREAGSAMCRHREKLMVVLDAALLVEERPGVRSRKVSKAAMHLLRVLLNALVSFRPLESRSVPEYLWRDPAWRRAHYRSWGQVIALADLEMQWRGPSREGLQWAADLEARYLVKPMATLKLFLSQDSQRLPCERLRGAVGRGANAAGSPAEGLDSGQKPDAGPSASAPKPSVDVSGCGDGGEGAQEKSARFPPAPLKIADEILSSSPMAAGSPGGSGGANVTSMEATAAVVQIRMIMQGLALVQSGWGSDGSGEEEDDAAAAQGAGEAADLDHCTFKAAHADITADDTPDLVALPVASEGAAASRNEIAALLHAATGSVLARRGEDVKLLQALAKALDTCLNGVDVLQKNLNYLRVRYTLIKTQFKERDGVHKLMPRCVQIARVQHHHMTVLMQRQRKERTSPVVTSLLRHMTQLGTYHYRSVRIKAQAALISCTRRYQGAGARLIPALVAMLEDTDNSGHAYEQRVIGAANLLQTGVLSKRILRDWGMLRRFVIALCRSDHLDKVSVHAVLVEAFNTFQSSLYQMELSYPRYTRWIEPPPNMTAAAKGGAGGEAMTSDFKGHSELQRGLVAIMGAKTNLHWRYRFMVIGTLATMLRHDVAAPKQVWNAVLDGLVSDISHLRKLCFRALSTALELLQDSQQSKSDADGMQAIFPDKNYQSWNGHAPTPPINEGACRARAAARTQEYRDEVLGVLAARFGDESFVAALTAVLSVVQSARAKCFVGSLAQMWKSLFKALGMPVLAAMRPFLDKIVSDKDGYSRLSTDVYIGQQCMASEVLGGLVRGIKYWPLPDQLEAQAQVRGVLDFAVSIPEMESAGIWASALRFSIFDRHATRVSWLMSFLFDDFPPYHKDMNSTLVCRRMALVKPIINELSWRGSPLHRQLLHDVEPYLSSPFTQTRDFASSCVSLLARVSWVPAYADHTPPPCAASAEARERRLPEPEAFATRTLVCPSELMHHTVTRMCKRMSVLSSEIAAAGVAADVDASADADLATRVLANKATTPMAEDSALKALKDELKHLRHSLVRMVSGLCPNFDGMYTCPMGAHLPALIVPLLQTLQDRDVDLCNQAKRGAEMAANTPMLPRNVLSQVLDSVYALGQSKSWHVRSAVLLFLQIIAFRHQFLMSNDRDLASIRNLVCLCL